MELKPHFTFLDYIQGGTDLACTIAIDFTGAFVQQLRAVRAV